MTNNEPTLKAWVPIDDDHWQEFHDGDLADMCTQNDENPSEFALTRMWFEQHVILVTEFNSLEEAKAAFHAECAYQTEEEAE